MPDHPPRGQIPWCTLGACPRGAVKEKQMHELGIVQHIAKVACQAAHENDAEQISAVTLELGEVSGVLPDLLTDCWNYFREKTPELHGAELKLVPIPAVTWCDSCRRTYETVTYGRTCPHCGSGNTWLLEGRECRVKEIEVYDG